MRAVTDLFIDHGLETLVHANAVRALTRSVVMRSTQGASAPADDQAEALANDDIAALITIPASSTAA